MDASGLRAACFFGACRARADKLAEQRDALGATIDWLSHDEGYKKARYHRLQGQATEALRVRYDAESILHYTTYELVSDAYAVAIRVLLETDPNPIHLSYMVECAMKQGLKNQQALFPQDPDTTPPCASDAKLPK